jgi:hypothetical protein
MDTVGRDRAYVVALYWTLITLYLRRGIHWSTGMAFAFSVECGGYLRVDAFVRLAVLDAAV